MRRPMSQAERLRSEEQGKRYFRFEWILRDLEALKNETPAQIVEREAKLVK